MTRWAVAVVAAVLMVALGGCARTGSQPAVDDAALEQALLQIEGVEEATIGVSNTGVPGSTALSVTLGLDESALAGIGAVLSDAVDAVAAHASGYTAYRFRVAALDAAAPGGGRVITLRTYRDDIPIEGEYLGPGLTLTPEQLAASAA
ncbi:hypothetical protein [Microbacterium hominis]|uniref:Lipoprotein n=1 Tax=Microbacterium hominis TaxID=162426 RepID=A0A7D4UK74_9MICO|nr:hypothetical protein [Microbacterium hominis]QKJ20367.1 hypothetical protein HQM25_14020 [Microbacterium hominis]